MHSSCPVRVPRSPPPQVILRHSMVTMIFCENYELGTSVLYIVFLLMPVSSPFTTKSSQYPIPKYPSTTRTFFPSSVAHVQICTIMALYILT